jgi:hypothetical protein
MYVHFEKIVNSRSLCRRARVVLSAHPTFWDTKQVQWLHAGRVYSNEFFNLLFFCPAIYTVTGNRLVISWL